MMSFEPFWAMLSARGISTYDLEYEYEINPAEISRLKNNHNFTLSTLGRYCELFHCQLDDIVIYISDKP